MVMTEGVRCLGLATCIKLVSFSSFSLTPTSAHHLNFIALENAASIYRIVACFSELLPTAAVHSKIILGQFVLPSMGWWVCVSDPLR